MQIQIGMQKGVQKSRPTYREQYDAIVKCCGN